MRLFLCVRWLINILIKAHTGRFVDSTAAHHLSPISIKISNSVSTSPVDSDTNNTHSKFENLTYKNHNINGKLVDHIINYPANNLHDKFSIASSAESRDRNAIKYWIKKIPDFRSAGEMNELSVLRRRMLLRTANKYIILCDDTEYFQFIQNIQSWVWEGRGKKVSYSNYAWCMESISVCADAVSFCSLTTLPSMMHSASGRADWRL